MKKNILIVSLTLLTTFLSSCAGHKEVNLLGEITISSEKVVQNQTFFASVEAPSNIDISWSVSNDLATVNDNGEVNTKSQDGSFILTASYGENNQFSASKLIKIHTPSIKELTRIMYNAGKNYNYTVTVEGKLFDSENKEVTKQDIIKNELKDSDAVYIYEDLVEKGNLYKANMEGFYWKYGQDGNGNLYEGGSYNSPDNYIYDYSMVNGKFTKGAIDSMAGMAGISDYKEIYTGDLSKFVIDEFKIEDSNLMLSDDKTKFLYDSKKDKNDFTNELTYSRDYSIAQVIYNTVDSVYAEGFEKVKLFNDLQGEISYTEDEVIMTFRFKNFGLSDSNNFYDYLATFKIFDIGSTIIPGLEEQIQLDKETLGF